MNEKIKEFACRIGVKKIGFSISSEGKTIIAALFPYYVAGEDGNVAMYARGQDYHDVCGAKLEQMSQYLRSEGIDVAQIHVDNGNLNDREAAFKSGLGFYGENGMLINDEYGSYFVIGQIVCDADVEADVPVRGSCLKCGECKRQCAGSALAEGEVDIKKCISYLTQKKGEFTKEEASKVRGSQMVWGCDICQKVCPHNKDLQTTAMPEFMSDRKPNLERDEIESLSKKAFLKEYGKYAFVWRGRSVLLRNASLYKKD